jgi:AraC-like DNA-binding protein
MNADPFLHPQASHATAPGGTAVQLPAPALRPFVQHYWRSLHNADPRHLATPDGRVDLVLEVGPRTWQARVYGSTTRPTPLPCTPGCHYLGIRFRPGRSRHFLRAAAGELTDRCEDAGGLLRFPFESIAARVAGGDACAEIDRHLVAALGRAGPDIHLADLMVRRIDATRGAVRQDELAAGLGRSSRWLQRLFLETVGVTPKFYARIARAEHTAALLAAPGPVSLADVAAQAGYADQSHMTRDFLRLAGTPPARWRAAFVQDAG